MRIWHIIILTQLGLFLAGNGGMSVSTLCASAGGQKGPELTWHDATTWDAEGRAWTNEQRLTWFDRLPARAESMVPGVVWRLSRQSAGYVVRFETDSTSIWVDYELGATRLALFNMTAIGVSGVDLYAKDKHGEWRWAGCSRPESTAIKQEVGKDMEAGMREYALYLPLRNTVRRLSIGVMKGARFSPIAPRKEKPLVFYGTSITHGESASRPGMACTAILGRRLGLPVVNLGFSGNGKLDMGMAELLADIDASAYIIDCLPNLNAGLVRQRCGPFVRRLREVRLDTPIILVEDRRNTNSWIMPARDAHHTRNHAALREIFEELVAGGVPGLYYIKGDDLLGGDAEASTDGAHPSDLGFVRQADRFEPMLRAVLAGKHRMQSTGTYSPLGNRNATGDSE
jgi:hypothetical protein